MKYIILIIFLIVSSLAVLADEIPTGVPEPAGDPVLLAADTTVTFLTHEVARLKEEKNALKDELRTVNIKMASVGAFLGLALSFLSLFIFLFLRLRRKYRIDMEEFKNQNNSDTVP